MDQGCSRIAGRTGNSALGDAEIRDGACLTGGGRHLGNITLDAARCREQKRPDTAVVEGQETLTFGPGRYKAGEEAVMNKKKQDALLESLAAILIRSFFFAFALLLVWFFFYVLGGGAWSYTIISRWSALNSHD